MNDGIKTAKTPVLFANELIELGLTMVSHNLPFMVVGAPGVGKTDIISQICESLSARLIISHPVVSDSTDFKGLPFVVVEKDGEKVAKFMPIGDLKDLIDATSLTVFFLDDLGQAPPSVQAAAMQLILGRRINGHKISEHVVFVAATNRKKDKAGVSGILEPVKSRFVSIVELQPDITNWSKWAVKNKLPQELIAFLRFRPEMLDNFVPTIDMTNSISPRTIANVARLMEAGVPAHLQYKAFSGAAGEGFAIEFTEYCKIYQHLPDADDVLANAETADLNLDLNILYALLGVLARKATPENMDKVVTIANRLTEGENRRPDFSVCLIQDCLTLHGESVMETEAFIKWINVNKDYLI